MSKKWLATMILVLAGVIGGTLYALRSKAPVTTISPSPVVSTPLASPTPQDTWESIVHQVTLATVAVQTFQGSQLIQSSTGTVISSDGLILTTADAVPTQASRYQILYEDKIVSGKVMSRDWVNNLALLKIEASNLNVATLQEREQTSGQELLATGKFVYLAHPIQFAQRVNIFSILPKFIALDTYVNLTLTGALVVNRAHESIGIVSLRSGQAALIPTQLLNDFLHAYFATHE